MTDSVRLAPGARSLKLSHRWLVGGCLWVLALLAAGVWVLHGWNPFQRPSVRVAFNQFPPYLDKGPAQVPVGFAAEILIQAAQNAGVDIHWVEINGSADLAFAEGKADLYPLMTITPERESLFHMSAPWWENQFALISTEGHAITDASGAKGKVIATRIGVIQTLSQRLFPQARFVNIQTLEEMERSLCSASIDGFFADARLLEGQLLQRTKGCAGQALHLTSIPDSKLLLGTASTKAAASINDKLFREIAKLALDGTLSRSASRWGIYIPYDTARLRQVVDAEARASLMANVLVAALMVLTLSLIQTGMVRRAKRAAELAQRELEYHAKIDILTGLPNRRSFMSELEGAIERSLERRESLAVGFLDLDGFKRVNDLLGHESGDELLVQVAGRLRSFFGGADTVARLGGDEFTFFLGEVTHAGALQMMSRVLCSIEECFWIGGKEVFVSASIGISFLPDHGDNSQQLLRNADSAMYFAKNNGKHRIEFWSRSPIQPSKALSACAQGQ